jgi:hypothetical protein
MRLEDKQSRREGNEFRALEPGSDTARAHETPTAQGFKNGEHSRHHKNQPPQRIVAGNDNPGNETQCANDAARHAPAEIKVGLKESAHGEKLARCVPKTNKFVAGDSGQRRPVPA